MRLKYNFNVNRCLTAEDESDGESGTSSARTMPLMSVSFLRISVQTSERFPRTLNREQKLSVL